jgi:hypothetical protein
VNRTDALILRAAGLAVVVCAVSENSHRRDADLSPPTAASYPAFARSPRERRRWDLSLAIAQAMFPEEGGPHGRWYTALVLYGSEMPTDDDQNQ